MFDCVPRRKRFAIGIETLEDIMECNYSGQIVTAGPKYATEETERTRIKWSTSGRHFKVITVC